MDRIFLLKNEIMKYPWGSRTFIADLTGAFSPSERPEAEMWLGAHPMASSLALMEDMTIPLIELIGRDPGGALGITVAGRFSNSLPFLLKVLAAERPLSIQAHPNKEQATEGFACENLKKIPFNALNRNYKDSNHKPELICALTILHALKGFRRNRDIFDLMDMAGASSCGIDTKPLVSLPEEEGLKGFLVSLLYMNKEQQRRVIERIMGNIYAMDTSEPAINWMKRLYNEYKGDIGVLSPLFLNIVTVRPGEALYITSGELHAYLEGAGLEIMANSDNVIRGGLTSKHVDEKELIKILDFIPCEPRIILPEDVGNNEAVYPSDSVEFMLSVISLKGGSQGSVYHGAAQRSAEIFICTEGDAKVESLGGDVLDISKGMSLFVPASVAGYTITGRATLYKAATPL